jgi:hypothetical protein
MLRQTLQNGTTPTIPLGMHTSFHVIVVLHTKPSIGKQCAARVPLVFSAALEHPRLRPVSPKLRHEHSLTFRTNHNVGYNRQLGFLIRLELGAHQNAWIEQQHVESRVDRRVDTVLYQNSRYVHRLCFSPVFTWLAEVPTAIVCKRMTDAKNEIEPMTSSPRARTFPFVPRYFTERFASETKDKDEEDTARVWLLTPLEFDDLPNGTKVTSFFANAAGVKRTLIKGTDDIDQDTRGGYMAFGLLKSQFAVALQVVPRAPGGPVA